MEVINHFSCILHTCSECFDSMRSRIFESQCVFLVFAAVRIEMDFIKYLSLAMHQSVVNSAKNLFPSSRCLPLNFVKDILSKLNIDYSAIGYGRFTYFRKIREKGLHGLAQLQKQQCRRRALYMLHAYIIIYYTTHTT